MKSNLLRMWAISAKFTSGWGMVNWETAFGLISIA